MCLEQIDEMHHQCSPCHSSDAAAARHQSAEPSVQPPHAPTIYLLHASPPIKHRPARKSAHAEEGDLHSNASHIGKQHTGSSTGWSHRHAAASVVRVPGALHRPANRIFAGVGPEGGGGHDAAAAGGKLQRGDDAAVGEMRQLCGRGGGILKARARWCVDTLTEHCIECCWGAMNDSWPRGREVWLRRWAHNARRLEVRKSGNFSKILCW